jgi:hypothetical protein
VKNGAGKIDSLLPTVKVTNQKYFSFPIMRAQAKDTCFIKIKNLKVDTLIYTIGNTNTPCPRPYINAVAIDKGPLTAIKEDAIIQIKQ